MKSIWLQNRLDEGCIDFSEITEETYDSLAMCDEKAMEEYLESECNFVMLCLRCNTDFPGEFDPGSG